MSDFLDKADDHRKYIKENDMNDTPYKPGQRLTLEHDDGTRLPGTVERAPMGSPYLKTSLLNLLVVDFEPRGFRVTEVDGVPVPDAPELPTEPGAYLDGQGDLWTLTPSGLWYDRNGETRPIACNRRLVAIAPFTRLDTEAAWRSKIAAEVIDWIQEECDLPISYYADKAREYFGVTDR